jgi:hypothetical protein
MDYYSLALSKFNPTIQNEIQNMYNNLPTNKKSTFVNYLFIQSSNPIPQVNTIENIRSSYNDLIDPMNDITNSFGKVRVSSIFNKGGKKRKSRRIKRKSRRIKRKSRK